MGCRFISGFDELEQGSEIYVYGTGKLAKTLFIDLKRLRPDVLVKGFVDSFKSGGFLYSIPVINVQDFTGAHENKIVVATMFHEEIAPNLKQIGVDAYWVYEEPERYTEMQSTLCSAVDMDLVSVVSELPSEDRFYILNCSHAENVADEVYKETGINIHSNEKAIVSNVHSYVFENDLCAAVEGQAKNICVVDVHGCVHYLAEILRVLTGRMHRKVTLYQVPERLKNVAVVDAAKLLFLAINKNGATSTVHLMKSLHEKYMQAGDGEFITPLYVDVNAGIYEKYRKFCVVRNPYERLASFYSSLQRIGSDVWLNAAYENCLSPFTFESFCKFVARCPDELSDPHFKSQTSFLTGPGGLMKDVTLLRMENYAEDIKSFFAELGEDVEITHKNKSRPSKVDYIKDYYTPELIKLVNDRFADDFVNFGYEFL